MKQDINNELDSELSSNVAYEILDYLAHNPNAEGSIESIAEWWLLEQRINKEMVYWRKQAQHWRKELEEYECGYG